jgi:omega-6 fatty acid desaturase (delta-12 desaturase)
MTNSPNTVHPSLHSKEDWKKLVAPFRKPSLSKASVQIANTMVAYVAVWIAIYFALGISWWLVLPLIVLGGGLLVRVFIIFHDCGHGSFFRSRAANDTLGFICGVFTFTPYLHWKWEHAIHHASSGNLDRRGIGDIWTMTLAEYLAASRWKRASYRFARNPLVMFVIAPVLLLLVYQRFPTRDAKSRERHSVRAMNATLLLAVTGMMLIFGPANFFIVQMGISVIGGGVGVFLFYVQHQFEEVVWERRNSWEFAAAAMEGSSFFKLPSVLQWFSGNIGFHHIHHLSPQIPNYWLQECHESHPFFSSVPQVTLNASLKTTRLKLWDEEKRRLVAFPTQVKAKAS